MHSPEQQSDVEKSQPKEAKEWTLTRLFSGIRHKMGNLLCSEPSEISADEEMKIDEQTALEMVEAALQTKFTTNERKQLDLKGILRNLMNEKRRLGDKFLKTDMLDMIDRIAPGNVSKKGMEKIAEVEENKEILEKFSDRTTADSEQNLEDLQKHMQSQNLRRQRTIRNTEPKTGRNDPCPCGSGLKYKKCHGKES